MAFLIMKMYTVPPDMNEKEKVIGGLININQFFWLLGGLALSAVIFAITFVLFGETASLIIALPFLFSGTPFAFYKKNGLTLYQLIRLKKRFKKKVKKLPNIRKEVRF